MRSIVMSSVIVALLVLTGCSTKDAVVSEVAEAPQAQKAVKETVVVDAVQEEIVETQSDISSSISSVEKKFTTVYFDFDKFNIREDMKSNVSNGANIANTSAKSFTLKLEGNCDEWGSDEYNFALGLKRANSVKKSLIAEGVDSNRITMVSYGESNPTCTDKTKDCWTQNRRVDFKLLP